MTSLIQRSRELLRTPKGKCFAATLCLGVIFLILSIIGLRYMETNSSWDIFISFERVVLLSAFAFLLLYYSYRRLSVSLYPAWKYPVIRYTIIVLILTVFILLIAMITHLMNAYTLPDNTEEPFTILYVGYGAAAIFVEIFAIVFAGDVIFHFFLGVTHLATRYGGPKVASAAQTFHRTWLYWNHIPSPKTYLPNNDDRKNSDPMEESHPLEVGDMTSSSGHNNSSAGKGDDIRTPPTRFQRCTRFIHHTATFLYDQLRPLPQWYAVLIIFGIILSSIMGLATAALDPAIVTIEIPLARLPAQLDGYRIAQLGDIHVGVTVGSTRLKRAIEITNSLNADSILLTGDTLDGLFRTYKKTVTHLSDFRCRDNTAIFPRVAGSIYNPDDESSCVFAVTGNHEYYFPGEGGVAEKVAFYRSRGVRVLMNEWVSVPINGTYTFDIAGVPDFRESLKEYIPWNFTAAVLNRDPTKELVLVAHQPKHAKYAAMDNVRAGLTCHAHVHGGQMPPFSFFAGIPNDGYLRGIYSLNVSPSSTDNMKNMWVYLSRGTFFWGVPFRLGARHHITLLVLRSKAVVGDSITPTEVFTTYQG